MPIQRVGTGSTPEQCLEKKELDLVLAPGLLQHGVSDQTLILPATPSSMDWPEETLAAVLNSLNPKIMLPADLPLATHLFKFYSTSGIITFHFGPQTNYDVGNKLLRRSQAFALFFNYEHQMAFFLRGPHDLSHSRTAGSPLSVGVAPAHKVFESVNCVND